LAARCTSSLAEPPAKPKTSRDPHCVIAASKDALDLVVEGEATKVSGEVRLHRVAEAYMSKYGWPVTVRECAFYADGAPTAGPPPYAVYEVIPQTAFGFPTEEGMFRPTRWRF
jgi:hypothetical protein